MLGALVLLLGCQLAGDAAARAAGLPLPGPVIGMVLLFALLLLRERVQPHAPPADRTALGLVAAWLLANLSVLFVPAGTGVVQQGAVLLRYGPGLLVALVVSTLLTLAVTGWVFALVASWVRR
jgi:putative effector of murein hydrolase LrgA (UPF0299 family)